MVEKHSDPAHVPFVLDKANASKPKTTPRVVRPGTKKTGKNTKRDEYPSDDSFEPSQDQRADK